MTVFCVHLLYSSSWKCHQLVVRQLLSGQLVRYGKGRRYDPSITYNITAAGSLSSSQPGRRDAVLGLHSSLLGATLLTVFIIVHFKSSSISLLFHCPQEKRNHNQLQIHTFQDQINIWRYVSIKGASMTFAETETLRSQGPVPRDF